MNKYLRLIVDSSARMTLLSSVGVYNYMNDDKYIMKKYRHALGEKLDLINPQTFNEKLQWLKLYDRKPIYTTIVDKFAVKQYVAERIGKEYIIPTLGVWDKFDDIDFDALPNQFVLKCTHDSGGLAICRDKEKFDYTKAKKKIDKSLKRNYYYVGREWPYKDVPHKIIAEQYMEDSKVKELRDYKIHCFNGEPKLVLVCGNRFNNSGLTEDFFSSTWEHMDMRRPKHPNADIPVEKPEELCEILELSKILSKDIPFLRTDFYIVNRKIYFGELTLFPASGFERFEPEDWDLQLGSWLTLPSEKTI